MSVHRIAPAALYRGASALADTVSALAAAGPGLLVVAGERGYDRLGARLEAAFGAAGARPRVVRHRGPCTDDAVAALAAAARREAADAVLGVGGGRVIDAAKAAAEDAGLACATIPTSPATCAAVTPVTVIYDEAGGYRRTRLLGRAPDAAALDPELLAGAPDRLLVAGVVDALAKVHEVRRTSADAARTSATARAALALCGELEALLERHAESAVAGDAPARAIVAEACVLLPGAIGGLAGEAASVAAAHPVQYALTALPGAHGALHGELVGFGVLVQLALAGGEDAVRREARRYRRLGLACHLGALGCAAARGAAAATEVAARAQAMAPLRASFPRTTVAELVEAIAAADRWARDEAAA